MEVRDKETAVKQVEHSSLLMLSQGSLNCISVFSNTSVPLSYDWTRLAIIIRTSSSEIINWWLLRPSYCAVKLS